MHILMPWLLVAWWPWRSFVVVVHYHGIIVKSLLGMCNLVARVGLGMGRIDGFFWGGWLFCLGWIRKNGEKNNAKHIFALCNFFENISAHWRCRWPSLSQFLPRSKISHISARSRLSPLGIAFMNHHESSLFQVSNISSLLHSDHWLIHTFATNKKSHLRSIPPWSWPWRLSGLDQEAELLEECDRLSSKFRVTEVVPWEVWRLDDGEWIPYHNQCIASFPRVLTKGHPVFVIKFVVFDGWVVGMWLANVELRMQWDADSDKFCCRSSEGSNKEVEGPWAQRHFGTLAWSREGQSGSCKQLGTVGTKQNPNVQAE